MKPLLEARQICKQFSGVTVLKHIDFTLLSGQVHALMGGNGAGKSTLMKIIAGVETPDSGELILGERTFARLTPAQAHQQGVYLVPQEPMLFPNLTVRENILFRLPKRADNEAHLQEKLQQLNCQLNLEAAASTLEVADQQMVEILRGLMRDAQILILDEPTASLTPGETDRLFRQIRSLQALGVGIVFISHKLPEIRQVASHVSVMRDGAVVLSGETAHYGDNQLIGAMTPVSRDRALSDTQKLWLALPGNRRTQAQDFPVLRVEDLTGEGFIDLNLEIRAGEIVGLAGLVGAGRSELAQLIFGVRKATAGVIEIDGEPVVIHSPREAIDLGIGFLTENRKEQGLFLELAAQENITMATLERDATFGMLNRKKAQAISDDAIALLNIRVPHSQVRAGGLSGGNQQKLLISRWVAIGPRILILDEPTRGVDVGAKSEIYRIMNQMARKGVAILMISSELPEVVGMSDRVYVMREGSIAGELHGRDISQENIMTLATGVNDTHHQAV